MRYLWIISRALQRRHVTYLSEKGNTPRNNFDVNSVKGLLRSITTWSVDHQTIMILLRFRVILLLYIQTTQIHIGDGAVQNNTAPNNTSPMIRPSTVLLNSSGYYHSQPNQISTTVRIPDGNSVHPSASHGATYLPRSVSFDGITQSTIALPYSVPVSRISSLVASKISTASKDGNFAQKTETAHLCTNSTFVVSEKSVRDSGVNGNAATASEGETSTQSSHVVANTKRSYNHFSGKTYSSASSTHQSIRTVNIIKIASVVQTTPSRTSHIEGDHLSSSSFNPGNSDMYPTIVLHGKSSLSTTQTSRNYQRITTMSSEAFRSLGSSALYSKTLGDYNLSTTKFIASHNITTSLPRSQILNTVPTITPAASGNVSYLSKSEQSTSRLTNILSKSQIHPSETLATSQNISLSQTTQTTQLFKSITFSMMTPSSQSMFQGARTSELEQMSELEQHISSSQRSDDRKAEETRSTSYFHTVLKHSVEQTQKSAITVTTSAMKYLPNNSERRADVPLYVLAICLPVGILLGFCLAFVYIKRSKIVHRTPRYSVTVEISSDYTMKRIYSIIDINDGNIIKDFYPGLKGDTSNSSNEFELTRQLSETTLHPDKVPEVTDFSS